MVVRLAISSSVIASSIACRHLAISPILVPQTANEESANNPPVPRPPVLWNRSSSHRFRAHTHMNLISTEVTMALNVALSVTPRRGDWTDQELCQLERIR